MSATQTPIYQALAQQLKEQKPAQIDKLSDYLLFSEEVQRLMKAQVFNKEKVYGYIAEHYDYLQERFSRSDNIIKFFHEELGLSYKDSQKFDNVPINFERMENVQRLFSVMIEYSVMPHVKEECADAFLDHIFHQVKKGKLDGFCGNDSDSFFIENTFIAFSQFIDFCEREQIYLDKDHQAKIQTDLIHSFLYKWSGRIYVEDENTVPILLPEKVALGQELLLVYFEHILKQDPQELQQFSTRIQTLVAADRDNFLVPVGEFILPFIEKHMLELKIIPGTELSIATRNFKI